MVEQYSNVTASMPGVGANTFGFGGGVFSGASDYECDENQMILRPDEYDGEISLTRVEKILKPEDTIPSSSGDG